MEPIRSIAEIPFHEKAPLELLDIRGDRDEPDRDYYDYGYARVDSLCLSQPGNPDQPIIRNALVLGMHAADDGEVLSDDIEVEFFAEEVEDDYSVTVLLSDFLANWLPRLSGSERAIVLALCNPHRATVAQPAAAGGTPVYYALGDLTAWLDYADGIALIGLDADEWRLAE